MEAAATVVAVIALSACMVAIAFLFAAFVIAAVEYDLMDNLVEFIADACHMKDNTK